MNNDRLLTAKEAARKLNIQPQRVWELTRRKQIPAVKIGERQYRYSERALENWIEGGGNQVSEVRSNEN
jgi:excisionase family DNA binding protein